MSGGADSGREAERSRRETPGTIADPSEENAVIPPVLPVLPALASRWRVFISLGHGRRGHGGYRRACRRIGPSCAGSPCARQRSALGSSTVWRFSGLWILCAAERRIHDHRSNLRYTCENHVGGSRAERVISMARARRKAVGQRVAQTSVAVS